MPSAAPLLERHAGIVVPAHALSKRTRIMARAKFLRLLRAMTFSREQMGLLTRFECGTCKQPVRIRRGDSSIVQTDGVHNSINVKKDRFSLSCECTLWTVRG